MQDEVIDLVCLCAAWCRTCEAYGAVFQEAAGQLLAQARAQQPGLRLATRWVDIEDESELLGDLDIETFPTLLIADARQVRFAGPLTPEPDTLLRLLRARVLEAGPQTRWPSVEPAYTALAQRVRAERGG